MDRMDGAKAVSVGETAPLTSETEETEYRGVCHQRYYKWITGATVGLGLFSLGEVVIIPCVQRMSALALLVSSAVGFGLGVVGIAFTETFSDCCREVEHRYKHRHWCLITSLSLGAIVMTVFALVLGAVNSNSPYC